MCIENVKCAALAVPDIVQCGHTSLKVLEIFFPVFQDLESPGKEYRSLKVLEFDARGP